jgi:AraC-like DNA-binding protein
LDFFPTLPEALKIHFREIRRCSGPFAFDALYLNIKAHWQQLAMLDTSLNSFNFYFLLAVFQGIVLSGLILLLKPFRKPHLYLGILMAVFSSSLLHIVLTQSIHAFNAKYPIPMDFSLAYGPLAYLHVVAVNDSRRTFRLIDLLHFLPTLLIDGVLFSVFFIYAGHNMTWAYAHLKTIQTTALIITLMSLVQLGIYTIAIFRKAREARAGLKEFAQIRRWLNWLLISWITIITFLVIALSASLFDVEKADENASLLYNPFGAIMALCIYGLGYLYLLRYRRTVDAYMDRLERFKFSEEEVQQKKQLLEEALETQKHYKDSSLTVATLAQHLEWPVNDLSFLINEAFHTNFNDWINQCRIRAFKEMLEKPENKKYSMVGLSQKVGFSSKASFYRAFKKVTGITPGDYLRSKDLQ